MEREEVIEVTLNGTRDGEDTGSFQAAPLTPPRRMDVTGSSVDGGSDVDSKVAEGNVKTGEGGEATTRNPLHREAARGEGAASRRRVASEPTGSVKAVRQHVAKSRTVNANR